MGGTAVHIRRAMADDVEAISAIYNDAIRTTTATFHTEPESVEARREWLAAHGPRHPVIVAEQGGAVVGWASLSTYRDRPAYNDTAEVSVYVAEDARGRGIGRRLLADVLERGRAAGLHAVIARIADNNPGSIRLHERVGFEPVGTMREVGRKLGQLLGVHIMQLIYADPGAQRAAEGMKRDPGCIFCRILAGELPATVVHRDGRCTALMDVQPVNPGHVLVVPNAHAGCLADLAEDDGAQLFRVAQRMAAALRASGMRCEGVNMFLADGEAAMQEVFHAHLNVFPRYPGDGFRLTFGPHYTDPPDREELERVGDLIRAALRAGA